MQELLKLFHRLDVDNDGRIPAVELRERLAANAQNIGLSPDQLRSMVDWADKNRDHHIDYSEFSLLVRNGRNATRKSTFPVQITSIRRETMTHAMLRAGQMVVPRGQREEKFSYLEQYTCCPPPFAMIVLSVIEVRWHFTA